MYRIAFFLVLAFAGIGPVIAMSILHSTQEAISFICMSAPAYSVESSDLAYVAPIFPSLISYIIGLCFYASHFPERILPEEVRKNLDMYGGGMYPTGLLSLEL